MQNSKQVDSSAEDVFSYLSYKVYLQDWLKSKPHQGYGLRAKMAESLRCQQAYISQVLNSHAHFNLEQAEALSYYLEHTNEERHFFLLLVQRERAATQTLKKYFQDQMEQLTQKRLVLKERLEVKKTLNIKDQAVYYSAWYYAAVHVALSIPDLQTHEALAKRFGLPFSKISKIIQFLISVNLATQEKGRLKIGTSRIHLADDSPLIARQHANWRLKALESMDKTEERDLHYSSVITLSENDVLRIKSMLVKWITETKAVIRDSKEEEIHCFNIDFFRVK